MPYLNPNNPFVANDLYFLNSTNVFIYKETPFYYARLANVFALVLTGIPLACFVLYLIQTKSPIYFYPYKKMLMLALVTDVFAIIQFALAQSRSKSVDGASLVTYMGPLSYFGYKAFCPIFALQTTGSAIGICVLPVQYFYRLYTITQNKSPSVFQTILWFTLSLCIYSTSTVNNMAALCFVDDPNPNNIDYSSKWFSELPIPPLLVWSIDKGFSLKQFTSSILMIVYYLISLWLARKTVKALDDRFTSITINDSVRKTQKQLSKTLFAQALIPLLTTIIPRIVPVVLIHLYIDTAHVGEFISMASVWYPIANLLCTIIFIEPYWKFVMGYFPLSKHYKWKSRVSGFHSSQQIVTPGRSPLTINNFT